MVVDDEDELQLRWGVQRRLEFIDFRLFWDGRFNRKDLALAFGISNQQASADVAQYEALAPGHLTYDPALKAYVRADGFRPRFIGRQIDRFLLQLLAVESGWLGQEYTWFDVLPPVEVVSLRTRPTNPEHLLAVLDAIRGRQELTLDYRSMTGSTQPGRSIAPHALVHSKGRWYARSWSRDHNDFRDFNLNRIQAVSSSRPCSVDAALDFEWAHKINLVLTPNPRLGPARQQAVALEYEMTEGVLKIPTRLSLSFYLMSEHNLDVADDVLAPEKQQLVLRNRIEVDQARAAARQMSKEALARADAF
ncbi:MAG: helix-turn-helix transcriptional regulator [Caulobacterales bacterium]